MKKYLRNNSFSIFLGVGLSVEILILLCIGFDNANKNMANEEVARLENSIRKVAINCYSIEGYYPTSIEYLKETYGLIIDESKYHVYYETIGSNIMPEIAVIRKE